MLGQPFDDVVNVGLVFSRNAVDTDLSILNASQVELSFQLLCVIRTLDVVFVS